MISNAVKMTAGVFMLVCVCIGYIPQPEYLVELTCISNTVGGLLLITDGALNIIKKKNLPNTFYLNAAASILMVFLVCMGSLTGIYTFNFKGAFFFMHIINPTVFILCYIFLINEQKRRISSVLTAPIMTMAYFLFDYIRCQLTGEFVYGFVKPEELMWLDAAAAGLVLYIFVSLLGLGLFALNRLVHHNRR